MGGPSRDDGVRAVLSVAMGDVTVVFDDGCSGCGSCLTTCGAGALTPARRYPTLDPFRCTGCLACIEVCPVDAITASPASGTVPAGGR